MKQRTLVATALLGLAGGAAAQAVYDSATRLLTVPTIDVSGQLYRNLVARLDDDGRLTIVGLQPPSVDTAGRIAAAAATANSASNACAPIRPFYWEVGDKLQRQTGGSVQAAGNPTAYEADTPMNIASASKWLYGAYVAEQRGGALTAEDIEFLNFRSGYVNFPINGCEPGDSVASCVARNNNGLQSPAEIGRFHYNGGHMQKHAGLPAPGMNLGALNNATLAAEMRRVLGTDISLSYTQPQLPGGVRTSATDYALFLRKLLNKQLKLGSLLGNYPVCTNPATCPSASYTPVPAQMSWHYSIGHWVEDDPAAGDGAFSSAGAFGFYPWIDASRSYYGVIARVALPGNGNGNGSGSESAACGALIRQAWISGAAQ